MQKPEMTTLPLVFEAAGNKFVGIQDSDVSVDLNAGHMTTRFYAYDDDRTYETFVKTYKLVEVEVPAMLNMEFVRENISLMIGTYMQDIFANVPVEILNQFVGTGVYGSSLENCLKLLTSNLRSEFRISLRNQLLNWLNDGNMQSPFSAKQWDCLENNANYGNKYRQNRYSFY